MTPRTCRLCSTDRCDGPLCADHLDRFHASGEGRRAAAIRAEWQAGVIPWPRVYNLRMSVALEDYITRVLAEREVERGRG